MGRKNRKKEGKVAQGRIFYMRKKDEWQNIWKDWKKTLMHNMIIWMLLYHQMK